MMGQSIFRRAALAVFLLLCGLATVSAARAGGASGPVVLTISGAVEKTNRPAADENTDPLFHGYDLNFQKAYAFDWATLAALPQITVTMNLPHHTDKVTVSGPSIDAVLKRVGAKGKTLVFTSLDKYQTDMPIDDLKKLQGILVLKKNGKPLGIGGFGPVWFVYTHKDGQPVGEEDFMRFPFGIFSIEVK